MNLRRLALFILVVSALVAQNLRWSYMAGYQVAGSTSAKVTLQLPSGATMRARPLGASISCPSASCTLTTIIGGTAATATVGTAGVALNSNAPAIAQAIWYTASNSTGGTSLPVQPLSQGTTGIGFEDLEIRPGERVSLLVTGSSQTVTVNVIWEEYSR